MNKALIDEMYKERYLKLSTGHHTYSVEQLWALRDMAANDVCPDGRFSDEECNIWSMFHSFSMKES